MPTTLDDRQADTFSLRRTCRGGARGLMVVAAAATVAGGAAWGLSLTLDPTYEAQATIRLHLEPGPSGALPPELVRPTVTATEGAVIGAALQSPTMTPWADETGRVWHPRAAFRARQMGSDVLRLTVQGEDREKIVALTDAWAAAAVGRWEGLYGPSDEAMAQWSDRIAAALAQWERLWEQQIALRPPEGFAQQKLLADAQVARERYLALAHVVARMKAQQEPAKIETPAALRPQPVSPPPRQYGLLAGLLTFAGGLFVLLVIGLSRLDR